MIFSVTFSNDKNEVIKFSWEMVNKPHALRWKNLMCEWKTQWKNNLPSWDDKWLIARTKEDYQSLIRQMKSLVEKVDSIGEYKIGHDKINSEMDREELNRLHRAFHEYVEIPGKDFKNPKIAETEDLCHKLNHLVHLTESAADNCLRPDSPVLLIVATAKPHMQVDYEEEDYLNYTPVRLAGWIYVGYATPGKSLYQCFMDNDLQVVQNKLVRPSQGLSNELHIELAGAQEHDFGYERYIREQFSEWCIKNKVSDYGYDYKKPIHSPGRIPLAKPTGDINKLLEHFNGRSGRIIDIDFT